MVSVVARSIDATNNELARIDLKISDRSETDLSNSAIVDALAQIRVLHDSGWHIGSYNMSFGSQSSYLSSFYRTQIKALEDRGIFGVAAAGNDGTDSRFEYASFPARLANVISVGSHDGNGNPTWFSQNDPATVHVLADGEDFPNSGNFGTSFSAPQVAATVATVQALVAGVRSNRLSFDEMIDVLQLGGAGPQSRVDPADGATTYFLHTHAGSVDYAVSRYIDPFFSGLEYIASFSDVEAAFGRRADAARDDYLSTGVSEGRILSFDALEYVASYSDLISAFGTNREAAATHYLDFGRSEGRVTTFDATSYMLANRDVAVAFAGNGDLATQHYISFGFSEGRSTIAPADPRDGLITVKPAVSEGADDLPAGPDTTGYVGVGQSATGILSFRDRDWFRMELTAGESVIIQARGSSSGGGSLIDPMLSLYDSNGRYLGYDDDGGVGMDAAMVYTPRMSGEFFIEVEGFIGLATGSYTVDVASRSGTSRSTVQQEVMPLDIDQDRSVDQLQLAGLAGNDASVDWIA